MPFNADVQDGHRVGRRGLFERPAGRQVAGGVVLVRDEPPRPFRDYTMHYYGPYSQALAETVADAESSELISQSGGEALELFGERVFDPDRVDRTRLLARLLSDWARTDLELAATIDYVASGSSMKKGDLLDKVRSIKSAHRKDRVAKAHAAWKKLARDMEILI